MATENQPQVILTGDQFAREQLAREMAALKDKPLDRAPAGGRFMGTDGKIHDAEGRPVEDSPSASDFDVSKANKAELEAEAKRRGVEVGRADGRDGDPTVEDFRAALK